MDRPVGLVSRPFWKGPVTLQSKWDLGTVGGVLVAILLLTVIGWLYLDQAAIITATETDIRESQEQREHLLREYRYLQSQIADVNSVTQITAQADLLSLQAARQINTLAVPRLDTSIENGRSKDPVGRVTARTGRPASDTEASWLLSMVGWLEAWFSPFITSG